MSRSVIAVCKCGGWVLASLERSTGKEMWARIGELAEEGFEIRTSVPTEEVQEMPCCTERGACTTEGSTQAQLAL